MSSLTVRRWRNEEFLAGRGAWQRLLAASGADPLFMSWDWLACWWKHHAAPLQAELFLVGVYSNEGELLGLAPFYRHHCKHRGIFKVRRLELLGNAWRDSGAVFSEYLDIIAVREAREAVRIALREWLHQDAEWDELLLCNVRADSLASQLSKECAAFARVRDIEAMTAWSISLPDSFETYTAQLSSNTRRKALHQREKLADAVCEDAGAAGARAALERLERFVARRWNRNDSEDARAQFHAELPERFPGALRLTELRSGTSCVSVMLNLRVAGIEYYLQSGFEPTYARGLSPGYLHLGYAIEAACRDGLRRFDFLAGRGLHRDYKRDFAAASTPLQTLHIVRKPSLRLIFGLADRLRGSGQIV